MNQTFEPPHPDQRANKPKFLTETLFKEFEIGYRSIEYIEAQKVFDRMRAIEKRGRYRH